jgi:hypothetical protein
VSFAPEEKAKSDIYKVGRDKSLASVARLMRKLSS